MGYLLNQVDSSTMAIVLDTAHERQLLNRQLSIDSVFSCRYTMQIAGLFGLDQ
jgi:ABC-type transporter Mla MlaB component